MLSLITLFLGALFFYVKFRFLNVCKAPNFVTIIYTLLLFIGIFNIHITLLFGHKLSFFTVLFLSFANLLLIYFFTATLFIDIFRIFLKFDFKYVYLFFIVLLPILSIYAVHNAFKFPNIKSINLETNNFKDFKKVNFVQISDLHVTKYTKEAHIEKIVDTVNSLNPSFIVITGDSVDDEPAKISKKFLPFKQFKAPVYMVFGNHEYYHDATSWYKFFKSINVNLIINDSVMLKNNDYQLLLLGIDFGATYDDKNEEKMHLIDKVFNKSFEKFNVNSSDNILKIVLSHHPKAFNKIIKRSPFLMLSGHTHGGMTFPISYITKIFNGGFLKGLYKKGDSYLYVSSGTSLWSGMRARLGCENEIVNIIINNNLDKN